MEMIDKIGKKAVDTYNFAAKATGKLAREIKLRSMLSENKSKISELYEDIGKDVYEKYLLEDKIEIKDNLLHDCTLIDIIASEIEDIRMELLKLKDLKQCPYCYYEIDLDYSYCPNCGKNQAFNEKKENNAQNHEKNEEVVNNILENVESNGNSEENLEKNTSEDVQVSSQDNNSHEQS